MFTILLTMKVFYLDESSGQVASVDASIIKSFESVNELLLLVDEWSPFRDKDIQEILDEVVVVTAELEISVPGYESFRI